MRVQLPLIRGATVLVFERGKTHRRTDRGAHLRRNGVLVRAPVVLQPRLIRLGRFDLKRALLIRRVTELATHLRRAHQLLRAVTLTDHVAFDAIGVGVTTLAEQRDHLIFGDTVTGLDGVVSADIGKPSQAPTHPPARLFTLLGVVIREFLARHQRRVVRRCLACQVRVPAARSDLVNAHHERPPAPHEPPPGQPKGAAATRCSA